MPVRGVARRYRRNRDGYVSVRPTYEFGGLNEDVNPRVLEANELVVAQNCARKDSTLGTRPGISMDDADYNGVVTGSAAIQGIHEFSYGGGASREVVVVSNGQVYITHDGTAVDKSATTITAGAGNQWTFADFQDKVFAAGGAVANDGVWYYAGASAALGEINFSFTTSPKYIFQKWNFLFLSGLTGTTYDDNPLIYRYCDFGSDATDVLNWPSTNVLPGQLLNENFGVGSFGSEYSTGFGEFYGKDLDFLLLLTNKRIFAYRPNDPGSITGSETAFKLANTIPVGCVSQNAFVSLGADAGDAIFMNKDGVHSLAQSRQYGDVATRYLSYKIRKTFSNLNQSRLDEAWGAYWPQESIVIFSVATGSNTTNDLLLVMDLKGVNQINADTVRWYKWELNGLTPNVMSLVRGSDGKPYVYVGSTAGHVARFNRDAYQDLTSSGTIQTVIETKGDDFDEPESTKGVGDAYIALQGEGGGNVSHTVIMDDGVKNGQSSLLQVPDTGEDWMSDPAGTGTFGWGRSKWGSPDAVKRHRVPGTGDSTTIGHRFQRDGAARPFFILLLDQHVKRTGETLDQEANTVS